MIVTTTPSVEGYRITGYYGIVFGEVITGINFLKDFGAGIRNLVGGRSAGYEEELMAARTQALEELQQRAAALGAHAIVGVDMDYEVLGQGNMLMVTASGTAVTVEAGLKQTSSFQRNLQLQRPTPAVSNNSRHQIRQHAGTTFEKEARKRRGRRRFRAEL